MSDKRYQWAAPGDVNAFFGLMLDNIADLVLTVSLLALVFGFPAKFALQYMIPGTSVGVLVGGLLFFFMTLRLARSTGHHTFTAMPLGLDTPSTFGMVFFVLGPSFLHAKANLGLSPEQAAIYTWHIGIWSIVLSGMFKFLCALGSNWVRRVVPRAGLLGSLTAVALVLISFLPLLEILHFPVVGFVSLAVILTTLVARVKLPWKIPGALGSVIIGGSIYYLMKLTGTLGHDASGGQFLTEEVLWQSHWLAVFHFHWIYSFWDAVHYLPIVIPFALATVVGGIDCVESAAAVGDEFDTGRIIAVDALATLLAGLCGGVIQTTPYIGHPAYKAMGGRAAYTLATALFIGGAGLLGYFGILYAFIPKATVFPILVFIGLEITAQSFRATAARHYPAIAIACVPAMAALVLIFIDKVLGDPIMLEKGVSFAQLGSVLQDELLVVRTLANGFIITSLLWASSLAAMIDRRLMMAAGYLAIAGLGSLFGIIHSPLPGSPLFFPWNLPAELMEIPIRFCCGYSLAAVLLAIWGKWLLSIGLTPIVDQESEIDA